MSLSLLSPISIHAILGDVCSWSICVVSQAIAMQAYHVVHAFRSLNMT